MSSNTNNNNPYRGAMGNAGENIHEGFGGSDAAMSAAYGRSDPRGTLAGAGAGNTQSLQYGTQYIDVTKSATYGRSDPRGTLAGAGAGNSQSLQPGTEHITATSSAAYGRSDPRGIVAGAGAGNAQSPQSGTEDIDPTKIATYGRSDPRGTQAGVGAGNTQVRKPVTDQINATTSQPYGQPAGSGYYDSSRLNTSASSVTGSMHGTGVDLRNATSATGPNSGQGIHADPYYNQGTGSGMPTSGSRAGMGADPATASGHHQHASHQSHSQHHHESVTDKEHCSTCHMVEERASQMGSMGNTSQGQTTSAPRAGMQSGMTAGSMGISTGTGMPSSASRTTGINEMGNTVVHEGHSDMHLRPGETVVEHETRVHRGVVPGDKSMGDSGSASMGSTGMGATSTGMGHGTAMGTSTGLSSGAGGVGAGTDTKNVSMADKMMGGAEKIAGKVTSNEEMIRRGEEKQAGMTASSKN